MNEEPNGASSGQQHRLDAQVAQDDIPGLYDRIAPIYDVWAKLTESNARSQALRTAAISDGSVVLEVAVGTGLAMADVVRANPTGQTIGIDISTGMLRKAHQRLAPYPPASYELKRGDALALDQPDDSVDVVLNSYLFDLLTVADQNRAILEIKRVLRPGGHLVLTNMTSSDRLPDKLYAAIYRLSPGLLGGCRGVEMSGQLEVDGFRIESRTLSRQLGFASEIIRARN